MTGDDPPWRWIQVPRVRAVQSSPKPASSAGNRRALPEVLMAFWPRDRGLARAVPRPAQA